MANTRGIRRVIGAAQAQWEKPWGQCMWTGTPSKRIPRCTQEAEYRNQIWSGHVIETCEKHTPADPKFRQHPKKADHA